MERWFPLELWRIIKNYSLGQNYWKRRYNKALQSIPKPKIIIPAVYTSATKSIRFKKSFERSLFFLNKPMIGTIVKKNNEYSMKHCFKESPSQQRDNIFERLTVVYEIYDVGDV